MTTQNTTSHQDLTLVLGATGKTGLRIVTKLKDLGVPVRLGSRSALPSFDWNNEAGWDDVLVGVKAIYINYSPDLAIPGATDSIQHLVDKAKEHKIEKLVLLSGRGEEEAQACEKIVQSSGIDWTIVRASWFFQNFSEGAFVDMVMSGAIIVPAGEVLEPFVDVDDIAEVASVALTQAGHSQKVYEVTGPRLMTFADIAADLTQATSRPIEFVQIPHEAFIAGAKQSGAPKDVVWLLDYLFTSVLDGRNAYLTNGVQEALGREPKGFLTYAKEVAATGLWRVAV